MEFKDLTGLGEAAKELINALSSGAGVLYEPVRIRRKAIAEATGQAEAQKILMLAEVENRALAERAVSRIKYKALQQQENIEAIIDGALPKLEVGASPSQIEPDWLMRFTNAAENVSDESIRRIWSKILAGEANKPGAFGYRTLNYLTNASRRDIAVIQKLATLTLSMRGSVIVAVVPKHDAPPVIGAGLSFRDFTELASMGVLEFRTTSKFQRTYPVCKGAHLVVLHDLNESGAWVAELKKVPEYEDKRTVGFDVGSVMLTRLGEELVGLAEPVDRSGILQYLSKVDNGLNWVLKKYEG